MFEILYGGSTPSPPYWLRPCVDLDKRLDNVSEIQYVSVSSRKPRRLVSVSSRTKSSRTWSRLGHLGLVSRLGLGDKGLVGIPAEHSAHGNYNLTLTYIPNRTLTMNLTITLFSTSQHSERYIKNNRTRFGESSQLLRHVLHNGCFIMEFSITLGPTTRMLACIGY